MRVYVILCIFFVFSGCFRFQASAIVTADNTAAQTDPFLTNGFDWDFVYAHADGSCVAVGTNWVVTAAHVANYGGTGTLTIDGIRYLQQEIIYHDEADLALIRYDKPLPGFYELYTGSLSGKVTVMVGYGYTGTVVATTNGPSIHQTTNYYYTIGSSGRWTERWGSNQVSGFSTLTDDPDGVRGMTTNRVFYMQFNAGGTEAGAATYDSGGGTFAEAAGVWKLAGINIRIGKIITTTGNDATYALSIPDYAAWINATIAAADGDDDSDEIPNWWEGQYADDISASTDQDGDGVSGYGEYVADTDPTDSNSVFRIESLEVSPNPTLTFSGSTAREYRARYTTNDLADPGLSWTTNESSIWGVGDDSSIVLPSAADKAYFRLEVSLP